jgi:hypothetical protein
VFEKINKKEDRNKLLNFNKELSELQMRSERVSK